MAVGRQCTVQTPGSFTTAGAVASNPAGCMVLTFYVGEAAAAFKQYAAYVQRRTATHIAQFAAALAG